MKKKTKIIIISAVAFVLLAGGATATLLIMRHNSIQQAIGYENYVETSVQNINSWYARFNSASNHESRVELFHGLNDSFTEYLSREGQNSTEVIDKYETTLQSMKEQLYGYYDSKVAEIEETELPEQLPDIIDTLNDNITRLGSINSEISDDKVITDDATMLDQLNSKIENLLIYFRDSNEWLNEIDGLNETFFAADRFVKPVIFVDFLKLDNEYEESSFNSDLVETELSFAIEEKRTWFTDWYVETISSFLVDITSNYTITSAINLFSELNDLVDFFTTEKDALFTPSLVDSLTESFSEALAKNLATLESLGLSRINERDFRSDAAEKAIESFNDLFSSWKENDICNEHLQTYEEMLNEAVNLGETEHIRLLRSEASRNTRIGFT